MIVTGDKCFISDGICYIFNIVSFVFCIECPCINLWFNNMKIHWFNARYLLCLDNYDFCHIFNVYLIVSR